MKTLLALALALAVATPAVELEPAFSSYPGGVSVATDASDNVYTAYWDYNPAGDIYLTKRDADGALVWEVRHDNTDTTRHEVATWVETDGDGNVLVSGTIRSGYSNPVNASSVLMKYSPTGQQLWRQVYGSSFDGSSTVRFVVDEQDRAYVAGLGVGPNGLVSTVRQFNSDGSTGWIWFDSAGIGVPLRIKRTPDGQFLLAARGTVGSINGYVRLDAGGRAVWSRAGVLSLTAGDAAGDAAGNTYLVNGDYATGSGTIVTKLSPTGAVLWERTHPISAFRVEVGPDGNPVISGFPTSGTGGAAFAKYSSTGDLLWTNTDIAGILAHSQMMIDAEGGAYLSGTTLFEMAVAKVDTDGVTQWTAYAPTGTSADMTLGSQGQVYVVGGTLARFDQDGANPPPTIDVVLSLSDTPDPVKVRSNLVYTAVATNTGNSAATGVTYSQVLPAGTAFVSVSTTQGTCAGRATVTCTFGDLPAGATATVTFTVRPRSIGTVSATGTVATTSVETSTANNTAMATTTVRR